MSRRTSSGSLAIFTSSWPTTPAPGRSPGVADTGGVKGLPWPGSSPDIGAQGNRHWEMPRNIETTGPRTRTIPSLRGGLLVTSSSESPAIMSCRRTWKSSYSFGEGPVSLIRTSCHLRRSTPISQRLCISGGGQNHGKQSKTKPAPRAVIVPPPPPITTYSSTPLQALCMHLAPLPPEYTF
jgi:hypothetical protein